MTKTIVIGAPKQKEVKTPIEFRSFLDSNLINKMVDASQPSDWKYIELICLNYTSNCDLMFAYDDPNARGKGCLFMGRWNDGIA
jgi:hypothetical protein